MTPVVRTFGVEWDKNYTSRGMLSGTEWAPLGAETIKKREQRGYGAGPILEQSGSLRANAVKPLLGWTASRGNFTKVVNPSADDGTSGGAVVTYSVASKSFRIAISGPKAEHMHGQTFVGRQGIASVMSNPDTARYAGSLLSQHMAARPFWYVNATVLNDATEVARKIVFGRFVYFQPSRSGSMQPTRAVTDYTNLVKWGR
jgi:hypothetical protein